jgi:hypothetical protein
MKGPGVSGKVGGRETPKGRAPGLATRHRPYGKARCGRRVNFILASRDESSMKMATYPQYLGLIHSRSPKNRGAAQAPASAGNIRGVGVDTGRTADRTQTEHQDERRRVTVAEAADILSITAEAVRTRIKRGRLDSVKDPPKPGGTVYVLLPVDLTRPNTDPTSQGQDQTTDQTPADSLAPLLEAKEETIEDLRGRVRYLERVLEEEREARTDERRRHDTLMAQLMQRIPELEPPAPPESPEPREEPERPLVRPERIQPERAEPLDPRRAEPERVPPERTEPRESPETAVDEQQGRGPTPDAGGPQTATERPFTDEQERRPWWRRWLGP